MKSNKLRHYNIADDLIFGGKNDKIFLAAHQSHSFALSSPQAADLSKPVDKKLYKGTNPSCHDFNQTAATCEGAPLLVGFTTGQIQLIYPGRREQGKLYNEEVSVKLTCSIRRFHQNL